ncbi:MAG: hypothetical protein WA989_12675 [Henriciella sp.]|uniref:hypothetical protein n=1 Tax=Henriciella sp. TaxID=1968823 RepID=UPI003C75BB6F
MKLKIILAAALAIPMVACTTTGADGEDGADATSTATDCEPGDPGYPDCQTGVPEIIE